MATNNPQNPYYNPYIPPQQYGPLSYDANNYQQSYPLGNVAPNDVRADLGAGRNRVTLSNNAKMCMMITIGISLFIFVVLLFT